MQRGREQNTPARLVNEISKREIRAVSCVIFGINLVDTPKRLCYDLLALHHQL